MEFVELRQEESVALLTIDRPANLNAINKQLIEEMSSTIAELNYSTSIHTLIITGSGEKAFVAGADILEMKNMKELDFAEFIQRGQSLMNSIEAFKWPVIAAINGYALGGGLELALACDIRIASENAKLGFPETGLGIIPGFGGTQRLANAVGKSKAMKMILLGETITAQQAFDLGLVEQVTSKTELLHEARKLAAIIDEKSPFAVCLAKKAINYHFNAMTEKIKYEAALISNCHSGVESKEGMEAFLQKRPADFKAWIMT